MSTAPTTRASTSCKMRIPWRANCLDVWKARTTKTVPSARVDKTAESVTAATQRREYTGALGQLAQLRPAVDAFFDQVMVMDEDPELRANRLGLLAQLQGLFAGVADLSRLPG